MANTTEASLAPDAQTGELGPLKLAPLLSGFGKYQLLAELGRGGMGRVYLAIARGPMDFRKLVVLKCLRSDFGSDETIRSMFLDEGRLSARLNHPNVVQTNDVGEVDGTYYMTMEFLDGQALRRLPREFPNARLYPRIAARIISDALAGLHYAHELRDFDGTPLDIVHRDLNPPNIFVTYEGVVKILDFGIAKTSLATRDETDLGVMKGKLRYMSPEQVIGSPIDRRVDIFAAGILLWELITGERLFEAPGNAAVLNAIVNKTAPLLSSIVPDIDPALDAIVARALEKDPDARYATAQGMRTDLEDYLTRSGRPILQEHLGQMLVSAFRERKQRMQEQIEICMSSSSPEAFRDAMPSSLGASAVSAFVARTMQLEPDERGRLSLESSSTALAVSEPRKGPRSRRRRVAILFVGAAAFTAAGGLGMRYLTQHMGSVAVASDQSAIASPAPTALPSTAMTGTAEAKAAASEASTPVATAAEAPPDPSAHAAAVVRPHSTSTPRAQPTPATASATATAAPSATQPAAPASSAPATRKFRLDM